MNERTLVLIKPDGVQRLLAGRILARYEDRGLKIVGLKLMLTSADLAERHYAVHREKPFFAGLAPTYAGLYQVNVTLPAGVLSGDAVPVTITVAGQTSPPVTMRLPSGTTTRAPTTGRGRLAGTRYVRSTRPGTGTAT